MASGKLFAAFGLVLGLSLAPLCARASDPWPGEAEQPPPDLNIVLYYNAFSNAGSYGPPHGGPLYRTIELRVGTTF